jgi:hypothetical protein
MRGPADVIAAMRGAANLPLDLYDHPEVIQRVGKMIAEVYVELGKAQLDLIPPCPQGYLGRGDGLRCWAPDKFLWLQEDAAALLSPTLYREFILPLDRYIAAQFPCVAFHVHTSNAWVIDQLLEAPEIDVIQLNLEIGETGIEDFFGAWKKVAGRKPVVIARMYEDGIWAWLDRVIREFPASGLTLVVTTEGVEQAKEWIEGFYQVTEKSVRAATKRPGG